jgi:hypothetical protein
VASWLHNFLAQTYRVASEGVVIESSSYDEAYRPASAEARIARKKAEGRDKRSALQESRTCGRRVFG